MPSFNSTPTSEELGYFYDVIHGRVALEELPEQFRPALKAALRSKTLDRLKRISQLGHTSVTFFSATHTRFSHAIGTMLVMNKLFQHVHQHGLSQAIFDEVEQHYSSTVARFGSARNMVHCHLLLAALYQDVGELPFQKVTSLYFKPVETDVMALVNDFPKASPKQWTTKKVFSILSLTKDMASPELEHGFGEYNREFLTFLVTGDGVPPGTTALLAILQMVDAVIDADRLDYVYRDASVTIGSLSSPSAVLESIVHYEPGKVIVNDPRPVTDFLSTRMRLWTFVYGAPDVRFRQVLLKTVLEGRWDRREAETAFEAVDLPPGLEHKAFMKLDDGSLMDRIENLDVSTLNPYRQRARALLLDGTLDYECRVLKRDEAASAVISQNEELPDGLFFDVLADYGHHQLYRPDSIFVQQGLTSQIANPVPLEHSAGAFSPMFAGYNSAMLVSDGYYIFQPREEHRDRLAGRWPRVKQWISDGSMFGRVIWEDARRGLTCPTDTRSEADFPDFVSGKAVSISYCSKDFPCVVRIVRELYRRRRRYWLFLRPFDGVGGTPEERSSELVLNADSVLAVVSLDYLERALNGNHFINIEVGAMHDQARKIPVVPVGVDARDKLDSLETWDWGQMNEEWRRKKTVIANEFPLRYASDETLREALTKSLQTIDQWKARP